MAAPVTPDAPARAAYKVTKAASDLSTGTARALLCGTAGTANLVDAEGNVLSNFPLQQGYNPISVKRVSTGGDADDIWALY
jgi:hypothetical protein